VLCFLDILLCFVGAGVYQCAMVVFGSEQDDKPFSYSENQKQVCLCRPFQISRDSFEVNTKYTIFLASCLFSLA